MSAYPVIPGVPDDRRPPRGFKSILQRIAARTADALEAAVAEALRTVTPDECRNYFAACGYDAF